MRSNPVSFFLAALALLILPLKWLLSAATAAFFHEICHLAALWLLREKAHSFHVSLWGCTITTGEMSEWKQAFCILAGPVGSLALLFLRRKLPLIALCGLCHGLYNLLPILPLDGGRLLRLLLYRLCPNCADSILKVTGILVRFLWIVSIIYCLFRTR